MRVGQPVRCRQVRYELAIAFFGACEDEKSELNRRAFFLPFVTSRARKP
jgi:hypothetical protein